MRGDNPDLFDTSHVRDDAAYWDALAERVAADAARAAQRDGFEWFAHARAGWVAASLLLAAALALMVLPSENSSASFSAEWELALAPADDVGRAIILRDDPPAIGALLLSGKDGGVR